VKTRSHFLLALVAVALAVIEAPAAGPQASEFPMAAVPPASVNRPGLPSGGRFEAVREPQGDVKAYPPLRSEKPLYGGFTCGSDRFGRRHFDFVIDESGDTGAGYDRLYVDVNGNRDLRDDRPVSGSREVPNQPKEGGTSPVRFEVFAVPWDYGEGIGVRPFRMQAVLYRRREGDARLVVGGETVRLGRFTAGGRTFEALLSQSPAFSVRYDLPETALLLSPIGADGRRRQDDWQGCHELRQRRPIGDTWYSFGRTAATSASCGPARADATSRAASSSWGPSRTPRRWRRSATTTAGPTSPARSPTPCRCSASASTACPSATTRRRT